MTKNMPLLNYLPQLTSIRGLLALYVLCFHFQYFFTDFAHYWKPLQPFFMNGYLGVDYFFLLSGFILTHVYRQSFLPKGLPLFKQYRAFLCARIARVYPLHLALLLFLAGIELTKLILSSGGAGDYFTRGKSIGALVSNLLLVQAWGFHDQLTWNGVSWSISVEWFAYLLFPLLLMLTHTKHAWIQGLSVMICIAGVFGLMAISPHQSLDHFSAHFGIVRGFFEFPLGIVLYGLMGSLQKQPEWLKTTSLFIIALLTIILLSFPATDAWIVVLFALSIPVLGASNGLITSALTQKPLHWIGEISYSIYMTHVIVIGFVLILCHRFFGPSMAAISPIEALGVTGLTILAILGCSATTYYGIEVPGRKLFRRLTVRKPSTPSSTLSVEDGAQGPATTS